VTIKLRITEIEIRAKKSQPTVHRSISVGAENKILFYYIPETKSIKAPIHYFHFQMQCRAEMYYLLANSILFSQAGNVIS
jgi:hypothetical protein